MLQPLAGTFTERECVEAERRAGRQGDREAIRKYPRESELFLH